MKVFILGLDGATFDQLDLLMREGFLPHIKKIQDNYARGQLQTIVPPVTGPAWLALATGLNPGKTGVYDYINRRQSDSYEMTPVSSRDYQDRAIWNILNKKGYKIGIFNYPTLLPAPQVDGFVVGGMGAHWGDEEMCYPRELNQEIRQIAPDYQVLLNLRNKKYRKNIDLFFRDIDRVLDNQVAVLHYLIQNKPWDFFFAVLSVTDWVQHVVWKDIDETHPLYNPKKSPFVKSKYQNFWKRIDQVVGDLQQILPPDIIFMIVSDHGFGPLKSVFYPNSWLQKKGWLKRKKGIGLKSFLGNQLSVFSESFDNKYTNALVHRLRNKVFKIGSAIDLIDLENSFAYSPEHNTMFGCINLTHQGKSIPEFKEQLLDAIRNLPNEIKEIYSVEIILPEQAYSGDRVSLSPDIFFIINGYEATVEVPFNKKIFLNEPSVLLRTGSHRPHGIFLAKGDMIKNIRVNMSILDIAPTVLALYQTDLPANLDGKVLTPILKSHLVDTLKIKFSSDIKEEKAKETTTEELDKMKQMLRSLGYL